MDRQGSAEHHDVANAAAPDIGWLPAPVLLLTPEGACAQASQGAGRLLGCPPQTLTGTAWRDRFDPADDNLTWLVSLAAGGRETPSVELSIQGDPARWFRLRFERAPGPSPMVAATLVETTAARAAACEREKALTLLDRVQTFSATGHWQYDIATGDVFWSDEVFAIYGLTPTRDPVSIDTAVAAYHPDDRGRVRDALSHSMETGEPFDFELRLVRPNGEVRHVVARGEVEESPAGTPHTMFGVFQDVTEERRRQQERARIEERLSLVVQASRDGIWDWNEDSTDVYYSDRFKELLGISGHGNLMPVDEARARIHPEDIEEFAAMVRRHLDGAGHCEAELRLRRDDGTYRWMLIKAVAAPRAPGQPRRIVGTVGDIDARKQTEKRLKQARAEALATSQAKTQFVAMVSHELRTPLNGLIGMLDLMDRGSLDAGQRPHLETASESARGLLAILDDLLDLSKLDADRVELSPAPFDIRQTVAGVAELFRPSAEAKGLTLSVAYAPALPAHLVADAARLRQILSNLVGNAVKFTEAGSVTVVVGYRAGTGGADPRLEIAVRDTGMGIPQAEQGRLFVPYSQIRRTGSTGGTGLGLAICKRLCAAMNGDIGVTSAPGEGSTFRFAIAVQAANAHGGHAVAPAPAEAPAMPGVPVPDAPAARAGPAAGPPRAHLLVAEDNAVNQRVIAAMLTNLGYSFEIVDNGIEAVEAVRRGGFDGVLMDVQMPELDGVMATRLIREEERDGGGRIPIIAITAHAVRGTREDFLAAGMSEFVAKPIEVRKLATALAELVRSPAGEEAGKEAGGDAVPKAGAIA